MMRCEQRDGKWVVYHEPVTPLTEADRAKARADRKARHGGVETMPCAECGGGNAVAAVAMARTPADLDRAIIDA